MKKTNPDYRKIIHELAREVNMSITMIAKEIGQSKASLYSITAGNNRISENTANKIVKRFPELNINYLLTGQGSISIIESRRNNLPSSKAIEEEVYKEISLMNIRLNQMQKTLDLILSKFN